jgi:SagB-type dehydrogenase family enzyme
MMLPFEDGRSLPLLYHLNSEPWMNLEAYSAYSGPMAFTSIETSRPKVPLPTIGASPLERLVARRQSCRHFTGESMRLKELASILHVAYGTLGMRRWHDGLRTYHRTVPSGGGLYPLELFVVVNAVERLPQDIYHYHARDHSLEPLAKPTSLRALVPMWMNQESLASAGVLIILTAVLSRTTRKYGPRGYRYVLLEAGHVAQNVVLRCVELGLGSVCLGGFSDGRLNRELGLDGTNEVTIYGIAVGRAAAAPPE